MEKHPSLVCYIVSSENKKLHTIERTCKSNTTFFFITNAAEKWTKVFVIREPFQTSLIFGSKDLDWGLQMQILD